MDKSNKSFKTEEKGIGLCPDCAVGTGTIFDDADRAAVVNRLFEAKQAAANMLAHYTAQAREVEGEFCRIGGHIVPGSGGLRLDVEFESCCQAEKVIFQFKTCRRATMRPSEISNDLILQDLTSNSHPI